MDIKNIVKDLAYKHGTHDPFALCKSLNILVLFRNLESVRGIYFYDLRKRIIYINYNLASYLKRQVAAHELGHAILHKNQNTFFCDNQTYMNTNKIEIEADTFAAELLIDDDQLLHLNGYSIDQISKSFGVQKRLVEYKIQNIHKLR